MVPLFDIFRVSASGQPVWIEPATDLDAAKERVRLLGASNPGKYLVYCQKSGNKLSITVAAEDGSQAHHRHFSAHS